MPQGALIVFVAHIDADEAQARVPIVGYVEKPVFQLRDVNAANPGYLSQIS